MPPPRPKRVPPKTDPAAIEQDRDAIAEALDAFLDLAPTAFRLADALESGGEFEALLDMVGRLEDGKRIITWILDETNKRAIRAAPDRFTPYPVPGGGLWKVSGGKERKNYDNDALIKEVAQRVTETLKLQTIVTGDGEPGEPGPLIFGIVQKVAMLVGATAPSFDGWRSGIARELRIDLKAYAEITESPLRARIDGRVTE